MSLMSPICEATTCASSSEIFLPLMCNASTRLIASSADSGMKSPDVERRTLGFFYRVFKLYLHYYLILLIIFRTILNSIKEWVVEDRAVFRQLEREITRFFSRIPRNIRLPGEAFCAFRDEKWISATGRKTSALRRSTQLIHHFDRAEEPILRKTYIRRGSKRS